jgi:uncharacterized sulfatase
MNFVFIMTDTQNKSMVGAYGNPDVDTPNLDRLAAEGIRFDNAYTACPLCTPARGALFSGLHPQVNGAWANRLTPLKSVALMGEIFTNFGYRTAYTGKWHLDGIGYWGDGEADGGFESKWWYDGKNYTDDLEHEFKYYTGCKTAEDLREHGFTEENVWAHRVSDRAVDFLETVGDEPFVLAVSFDEPHSPFVTPPEYWEQWEDKEIPEPPNYYAPLDDKPGLQQSRRGNERPWSEVSKRLTKFYACNSYVDREIGRVIDAVDAHHAEDTIIVYTTDHGDMLGAHGLWSKGPMMYDEITNIPFIIRVPDGPKNAVSKAPASHVDVIPTFLDYAGKEIPERLHGVSLRPTLEDPDQPSRDTLMVSWNRFGIEHDTFGEFYPIRCITDGRYKLVVNLLETDEFYDRQEDPQERRNLINATETAEIRNALHRALIDEMERIQDPFRTYLWANRPWNALREPYQSGGKPLAAGYPGFPWQTEDISAPWAKRQEELKEYWGT